MVLFVVEFGKFSKVRMKFLKFHLLKHFVQTIKRHGAIPTTRSSENERKMIIIKNDYRSSNKHTDFISFINHVNIYLFLN